MDPLERTLSCLAPVLLRPQPERILYAFGLTLDDQLIRELPFQQRLPNDDPPSLTREYNPLRALYSVQPKLKTTLKQCHCPVYDQTPTGEKLGFPIFRV